MSDKRNRLIAGRVRDAEKSSKRLSAKADLRNAASLYLMGEDEDPDDRGHDEDVPARPSLAAPKLGLE